jgi:alpha-tubulin suppressor-like RCC1 family protein
VVLGLNSIGDGGSVQRNGPVKVGTGTWRRVSSGDWDTCGVQKNGTLWCWGHNAEGELGDGTTTDRLSPTQVGAATTWASAYAYDRATCAIGLNRSVWCRGNNTDGQLGIGSTASALTPIQVSSFTAGPLGDGPESDAVLTTS